MLLAALILLAGPPPDAAPDYRIVDTSGDPIAGTRAVRI